MDHISTFCLSAVVFLSLPLPLFASVAIGASPTHRRSLMPWVWANVAIGLIAGLSIIAMFFPPVVAAAVASIAFVHCGAQMFRSISLSRHTSM